MKIVRHQGKHPLMLIFLIMAVSVPVSAYQWPVKDPIVLSGFGKEVKGEFETGIWIEGSDAEVRSAAAGNIVFYHQHKLENTEISSELKSFLVVEHERGILSVYGNLDRLFVTGGAVSEGEMIGTLEQDSSGLVSPLYFQVLDYEFNRYVNPLFSLPVLPEKNPPVIETILLVRGDRSLRPGREQQLEAGRWKIYIASRDAHQFEVYLNGEEKTRIALETIEATDNHLLLARIGNIRAEELFDRSGYHHLGEFQFSPGSSTLEIAVSDFTGNEINRSILLRVR
jgi:hypothetical protein